MIVKNRYLNLAIQIALSVFICTFLFSLNAYATNPNSMLTFLAEFSAIELTMREPKDLTMEFLFKNEGPEIVYIYPNMAVLSPVSGWGGPTLDLKVSLRSSINRQKQPLLASKQPDPVLLEIRDYYGPPAQPPAAQTFQDARVGIKPFQNYSLKIKACWIPNMLMKEENLAISTLDPENMDGLKGMNLLASSVLVVNDSCKQLFERKDRQRDFLRPSISLFIDEPGEYEFRFAYRQETWVDFKPEESLNLNAPPARLLVKK
jgi:hypothetical protein